MSARCICTHFGKYFHNNVPTQINIPSWSHPSNHVRFHNNSMIWMPYNVNPFGTTFPVLDWHDVMRMEYPLAMWNLAQILSGIPHCSYINTAMIMDWQYGISRPNATTLDKNKYCINSLKNKYCINSLNIRIKMCTGQKRCFVPQNYSWGVLMQSTLV